MIKTVHPFPARMAPGLALNSLTAMEAGSVVLDPMSGSGTVLRQATELGHKALGYDMDPLAVLMGRVWTSPVSDEAIEDAYLRLNSAIREGSSSAPKWQSDAETTAFAAYWFAPRQREALSLIANAIAALSDEADDTEQPALDVLRLALSRIIVTKEQAASLARDTSHSRPHRVATESTYDVPLGFSRSLSALRDRLKATPPSPGASVERGDARRLVDVATASVDAVVTSPPYLNAIDYLRGHRLSLIWLGWSIPQLRRIRSDSIGSERGPDSKELDDAIAAVVAAIVNEADLLPRHVGMVRRYAGDVYQMVAEVARVLKPEGSATFVVGDSCLKSTYIRNADGVAKAASAFGLKQLERSERDLPTSSRYLPVTGTTLEKRMKTEVVLRFTKPKPI